VATAITFALTGFYEYEDYEPYYVKNIYVEIDGYGNVSLTPYDVDYDIWHEAGAINIILRSRVNEEDISIAIPDGWEYLIGTDREYDYMHWYGYNTETYEYATNQEPYTQMYHSYGTFETHYHVAEAYGEYEAYYGDEAVSEEHYDENKDYIIITITPSGGVIGYGLVPFSSGIFVHFNSNGANPMPDGSQAREVQEGSFTVGAGGMPILPGGGPLGNVQFMSWNFQQDGMGQVFDHDTPITQDTTVYAQWGYLVTFSDGNPTLNMPPNTHPLHPTYPGNPTFHGPRLVPIGGFSFQTANAQFDWVNIAWPNPPTKPGHTFTGWDIIEPGSGSGGLGTPATPFTGTTVITNVTELWARWTLNPIPTVTFDPQGGVLGSNLTGGAAQSLTRQSFVGMTVFQSSGVPPSLLTQRPNTSTAWPRSAPQILPGPGQSNMTLANWWTQPGGWATAGNTYWSGPGAANTYQTAAVWHPYNLAHYAIVDNDITVYANWVFRMHFHPNGGRVVGQVGGNWHFWSPYDRWDWNFRDMPVTTPAAERTVGNSRVYRNGHFVQGLPDDPMEGPTTIHIFAGWWSHPVEAYIPIGSEPAGVYQITNATPLTGNRTVYARWLIPGGGTPVNIAFNVAQNGGNWPVHNSPGVMVGNLNHNITRVVGQIYRPYLPERAGHMFYGWFPNPDGTGERFTRHILSTTPDTLYAVFLPYVRVVFDLQYGVANDYPQTVCANAVALERRVPIGRTLDEFIPLWHSGDIGIVLPSTPPGGTPVRTPWYGYFATWRLHWWVVTRPHHEVHDRDWGSRYSSHWNTTYDGSGGTDAIFTGNTPVWDPGGGYLRVYAQWRAQVVFIANPPGFSMERWASVAIGHSFNSHMTHPHSPGRPAPVFPTLATWPELSVVPHALLGWNTAADGSGTWFTPETIVSRNAANPSYPGVGGIGNPLILYAIWSDYVVFNHGAAPPSVILPHHQYRSVSPLGQPLSAGVSPIAGPGGTFPTGIPVPAPVWSEHEFIGWNTQRDGFGVWVTNTFQVVRPIQVYAIWNATVIFNATGGTVVETQGQPARGLTSPVTVRALTEIGRDGSNPLLIGPQPMAHLDPQRPHVRGPWEFVHWNTHRWGLLNDTGYIYTYYNRIVPHNMNLYAQWQTNVIFDLDGGNIEGNPADVTRTAVPELSIMDNRPVGQGMPPDPVRQYYTFVGWEREIWCTIEDDYIWVPFTGQCEINEPNILVVARWVRNLIPFEFIKTNDGFYFDGINLEPLAGAVFSLWRQVDTSGVITWQQVEINPGAVFPASVYELASAPVTGAVGLMLTHDSVYRLREISVPAPFSLPPDGHYWEITTGTSSVTSITRIHPDAALIYRIPELRFSDDVWRLANMRDVVFRFHKTDWGLYANEGHPNHPWEFLLAGAQFRMFRFIGTSLGVGEQVIFNADGTLADPTRWEEITQHLNRTTSTGLTGAGQYIRYDIDPRYVYHIVESVSPPGYAPPWGQWRINVVHVASTGLVTQVVTIGDSFTPGFIQVPTVTNYWFVGNRPQLELPLTGGDGVSTFTMAAGFSIVCIAGAILFMFIAKKKHRNK